MVNVPRLFIKQNKGDSGGLAWVFRYNKPISNIASKITFGKAGKFNNRILSVAGVMTLAEASAKANEYNALIANGIDPQVVEKEKIDNLVKDLESYKDKKELKENPTLQNFYIKFIDFVDSLKKSFSLNDNSQGTTKSIKDNPISSEEKSE